MNKLKGGLSLLGVGFIYGFFGILIRFLGKDLNSFQQIFFRNFMGLLVVLTVGLFIGYARTVPKGNIRNLLGYSLSFPAAIIFFTFSILTTKIALTVFSLYVGSILGSLIIGMYFFNEKLNIKKGISIALLVVGLYILSISSLQHFNLGLLYGFLSGICDAIAYAFKKHLSKKISTLVLIDLEMLSGTIIGMILLSIAHVSLIIPLSVSIVSIGLFFGAAFVLLSYLSIVGFKNFDLNLGTIITASELVFAPLFAAIVFREYPTVNESIGGLFIILAIVAANMHLRHYRDKFLLKELAH